MSFVGGRKAPSSPLQRVSQDLAQLRSFRGGLVDRGVVPEMELLEFRLAEPPKEFAAAFAEREVMRLLRRYVVKRKPLAIADIYLHPMAKAISWEIAERHDTYAIFGEFLRMPVARAAATIRADVAGRTMGRLLDLRPSDAVLVLIQTHYAASGEVLVRSALYVRADSYELHIDMLGGAPSRTVSPVRQCLILRGGTADGTYTDASGRGGKRDRHNIGVVRLRSLQCDVGSRLQQDILSLIRPARRYAAGIPHLRRRHGSAAGRRHHLRPAWRSHRTPSDADRDGQYHGRLDGFDRSAAVLRPGRRAGADSARPAALRAGHHARRRMGRRRTPCGRAWLRQAARPQRILDTMRYARRHAAGDRGARRHDLHDEQRHLHRLGLAHSVPGQRRTDPLRRVAAGARRRDAAIQRAQGQGRDCQGAGQRSARRAIGDACSWAAPSSLVRTLSAP